VFQQTYIINQKKEFSLAAIMRKSKYDAMPESDKQAVEEHANIEVKPIKIQNPNNPVKRLEAVLITVEKP